ncbi:DUF2690 domain-containing protein [Streptomyces griseoloalbus]|uniref:DUF2690 domain-containing protein n=1 Tax=Streptomyces griseoloalbus TaxID=67303 RepID=A0ABV3E5D3_9ACTN
MTAEHTRLTAALRELRTRAGLSLAALAARTAYSKSSWERYLNGKAMPPRQAVRDLCRIAGEPDGRLLALWEIAESEWSGRAAGLGPASASASFVAPAGARPRAGEGRRSPGAGRSLGRRGKLMLVLTSVYTVIAGGVALTLLLLPNRDAGQGEPLSSSSSYVLAPRCHGAACEGRDPMRMVCGIAPDSLTTYRTATGAQVELRYSEKCGASWARMWGARIGDRVDVTAGGPTREVRTVDRVDVETYVYTEMTAARPGSVVRSCFRPAAAGGERECFDARVGAAVTSRPPSAPQGLSAGARRPALQCPARSASPSFRSPSAISSGVCVTKHSRSVARSGSPA